MGKIIKLGPKSNSTKVSNVIPKSTPEEHYEMELQALMSATGLDEEGALAMIEGFYRRYPMLIESARDPNLMFRRKR